jgi:nicotinamidase-related amidase
MILRNQAILKKETTALLVIDIQERIFKVMLNSERVIENTLKLINGFKIMGIPIFYTEQYPKGLGITESRIKEALKDQEAIQKLTFSCYGADNLFEELKRKNISQVVLSGIESHVCVQQTALDLTTNNFRVYLAADAVSSRKEIDYNIALQRMVKHNIEVTTTESILFELLNVSGTDEFKAVSKLVK